MKNLQIYEDRNGKKAITLFNFTDFNVKLFEQIEVVYYCDKEIEFKIRRYIEDNTEFIWLGARKNNSFMHYIATFSNDIYLWSDMFDTIRFICLGARL